MAKPEGMTTVAITQISDFDAAFGHLGTRVGPRIGPAKRTQDAKEWFVLRHFMASALPAAVFDLPIEISKVHPPEPDFAVAHGFARSTALIEITEATYPDDQREMTEFVKSGKDAMLLGDFGGRFAGGASQPKFEWTLDICDALLRKHGKSICASHAADRHLIIYPNSNASQLIFDEDDERDAFAHLKACIDKDRARYGEALNGCQVHILGKRLIGLDITGRFSLIPRAARVTK